MSASNSDHAAPPRPAVMGPYRPDWLEKPTVEDMEWAYPAHAQRREIGGKAVIHCRVADDGGLRDCQVVEEAPRGEDFGVAALALSQKFRMIPPDGPTPRPIEVSVPIIFKIPGHEARPVAVGPRPGTAGPELPFWAHLSPPLLIGVAAVAALLLVLMIVGLGRARPPL